MKCKTQRSKRDTDCGLQADVPVSLLQNLIKIENNKNNLTKACLEIIPTLLSKTDDN